MFLTSPLIEQAITLIEAGRPPERTLFRSTSDIAILRQPAQVMPIMETAARICCNLFSRLCMEVLAEAPLANRGRHQHGADLCGRRRSHSA